MDSTEEVCPRTICFVALQMDDKETWSASTQLFSHPMRWRCCNDPSGLSTLFLNFCQPPFTSWKPWHVCHCNRHRGTGGTSWITWWGLLNHFGLIIFIEDWSCEPLRASASEYAWALESISVLFWLFQKKGTTQNDQTIKYKLNAKLIKQSYITLNQFQIHFLSNFDDVVLTKLDIDKSIKTVRELSIWENFMKYFKKSSTKLASPTTFASD